MGRPCKYTSTGKPCPRGEDCNFCHFPHGQRKFQGRDRKHKRNVRPVFEDLQVSEALSAFQAEMIAADVAVSLAKQVCDRLGDPLREASEKRSMVPDLQVQPVRGGKNWKNEAWHNTYEPLEIAQLGASPFVPDNLSMEQLLCMTWPCFANVNEGVDRQNILMAFAPTHYED